MTIRRKVVLLLVAVSFLSAATSYLTQKLAVMPSFVRLEQDEANENIGRAVEALRRDLDLLSVFCHDWSAWDDLYTYIQGTNPSFAEKNCVPETFTNNHLGLICLIDLKGQLTWGEARDYDCAKQIQLPDLMNQVLRPGGVMTGHTAVDAEVKGFIMTEHGPMLIASRPIVKSTNEGPISGTLVMGRWLSDDSVKELRNRTRVALNVWPIHSETIAPADRAVLTKLHSDADIVLRDAADDDKLLAYGILQDLSGQPLLLLRADTDKSITARGAMALRMSGTLSILGAIVIAGVIWMALHSMVVRPLLMVRDHMIRVGRTNDLRVQMALGRPDEIGTLADEFDRMVAHLRDARSQMLEIAHGAGMAEIATDVLHNVGNAMNTINVTTDTLSACVHDSKTTGLDKAAELLHSHESDLSAFLTGDPRGQKLPGYLIKLSQAVQTERGQMLEQLQTLQQKVHHVRDIIMLQQHHASGPALQADEDLAELVDGALRMHEQQIEAAAVTVERDYQSLPPIPLNRVKFTQVLVNLIKNAIEAMQETTDRPRKLTVRLARDGDAAVRLDLSDTGTGLAPEVRSRLFQHGFTTKEQGHGFGLHYCANAMKEMGGSIDACGDGPEPGSIFTLRFAIAAGESVL